MFKKIAILGTVLMLGLSFSTATFADQTEASTTTMENCGALLFEWRPVDCGDSHCFAILIGGNTISKNDVILNRGCDYPYAFGYTIPCPWGEVSQLANVDGIWGIPENWAILPGGSQSTLCTTLATNNNVPPAKEWYIDAVSLPRNINSRDLPAEIRRYLINMGGSDAGAHDGTTVAGWEEESGLWRYRKSDDIYVSSTRFKLDGKQYYMNEQGIILVSAITPDSYHVNVKGEETGYIPGWLQDGVSWKCVRKNGYYAVNQRIQDTDGKWYCFDMAAVMLANTATPDGYYADASGAWDGQPVSAVINGENPGPGVDTTAYIEK